MSNRIKLAIIACNPGPGRLRKGATNSAREFLCPPPGVDGIFATRLMASLQLVGYTKRHRYARHAARQFVDFAATAATNQAVD